MKYLHKSIINKHLYTHFTKIVTLTPRHILLKLMKQNLNFLLVLYLTVTLQQYIKCLNFRHVQI